MARQRIPRILEDWLNDTDQDMMAKHRGITLSDAHLLEEAEWCLYCQGENSYAFDCYHPSSWAALRRFVDKLRSAGVQPKHDFEF